MLTIPYNIVNITEGRAGNLRIMQDGTVCKMMTFEVKLDIVNLGFLSDCSEQYVLSYLETTDDY
ncbi:MAG TPA: hypothetical protein VFD00_04600 [Thermoclostridium sp.]|nr:hypothetical protein [Thermoclostridium sp.]